MTAMHPRVSLHQICFMAESTTAFVEHCRASGVRNATLVTNLLMQPGGLEEARAALAGSGVRCSTVNHPFAMAPNLEQDEGQSTQGLLAAIDIAAALDADNIYLVTGGRGSLSWEEAAARFAERIAPCLGPAAEKGMSLLVEPATYLNADIHFCHTLDDTIRLAEIAGIGVCIELHACWFEGNLKEKFRRAMPLAGLVQASDYVAGDRTAPCRAVPGDGMVPLERLLAEILDAGYTGLFDLELIGPRIDAEGNRAATGRAAKNLSEILARLGVN